MLQLPCQLKSTILWFIKKQIFWWYNPTKDLSSLAVYSITCVHSILADGTLARQLAYWEQ